MCHNLFVYVFRSVPSSLAISLIDFTKNEHILGVGLQKLTNDSWSLITLGDIRMLNKNQKDIVTKLGLCHYQASPDCHCRSVEGGRHD